MDKFAYGGRDRRSIGLTRWVVLAVAVVCIIGLVAVSWQGSAGDGATPPSNRIVSAAPEG